MEQKAFLKDLAELVALGIELTELQVKVLNLGLDGGHVELRHMLGHRMKGFFMSVEPIRGSGFGQNFFQESIVGGGDHPGNWIAVNQVLEGLLDGLYLEEFREVDAGENRMSALKDGNDRSIVMNQEPEKMIEADVGLPRWSEAVSGDARFHRLSRAPERLSNRLLWDPEEVRYGVCHGFPGCRLGIWRLLPLNR